MIPRLPKAAWIVLGGDALSAVGSGMTLPFLLVYLHTIRGLSLTLAGLAIATIALVSLAGNPLGGTLADRFGARATLVAGLSLAASGTLLLLAVRAPWHAFAATALLGLGASVAWPAQDALLARVAGADHRSSVFSVRHATLNAGLAVGALIAATLVDGADASTFTVLYIADGATFLAFIPILLGLKVPPDPTHGAETGAGGFAAVLRDRVFVRVWLLCALVVTVSYGQLHAAFPAYATRPGGISAGTLSIAFAANALIVVGAQLLVLRRLRGHRRTTAVALACATFAVAWTITLAAGQLGGGGAAQLAFVLALGTFALAETLLSPTFTAIVNDIAPEHLRGRYNGLSSLAWTTGFLLGPAIAGVALDAGVGDTLFSGLIAASLGAALGARRLAGHLSPGENLIEGPPRGRRRRRTPSGPGRAAAVWTR